VDDMGVSKLTAKVFLNYSFNNNVNLIKKKHIHRVYCFKRFICKPNNNLNQPEMQTAVIERVKAEFQ